MDYEKLLGRARKNIENLPRGQVFFVKDLFRGTEWSRLSRGEKLGFGKFFKNAVSNQRIPAVQYLGKADNNSAQYQVIQGEEE